ncbi:hypothetical protein [Streptomyces sp. NPDC046862]|uniref:hypothetical protein n=1 Tax=Streptomyces sp. NPDC046862 TaxID=3154603 RepID=UPI003453CEDB
MSTRTTFEDRLLGELQREIQLREAGAGGGRPKVGASVRRFAIVAAACAVAWVAAVVVPGSPTGASAYAVEPVGDGRVKLTFEDQNISVGAQRELAEKVRPWGIHVTVDVLALGYVCERSKVAPIAAVDVQGNRVPIVPIQISWDITLRRGNVLAFENTRGSSQPRAVELYATRSEAKPCIPMKVALPDD